MLDPMLLRSNRVGAPIVQAFFQALGALRTSLRSLGSDLALFEGDPAQHFIALAHRTGAADVFYNEDYEPEAIRRDLAVTGALQAGGLTSHTFLDHVYFGADEIEQNNGRAYKVFTPYRKRWLETRHVARKAPVPSPETFAAKLVGADAIGATLDVPRPEDYGHGSSTAFPRVEENIARRLLETFLAPRGAVERYKERRNVPSLDGTSHLSPHLRAGTIGVRECVERAFQRMEVSDDALRANVGAWIDELIWRDFYQMILRRFPHAASEAFLDSGKRVAWRQSKQDFSAWCAGRTGYPIVDAAMRQLNTSGWMHNRLRMIVASFLTKDLLLDWRLGERYFEQHLADADRGQNNGGWQWAASTGTDATPYFRIFNPIRQSKIFDPSGTFIRSMLPELRNVSGAHVHEPWMLSARMQAEFGCEINRDYPAPIVDHEVARRRALETLTPVFRGTRHTPAPVLRPTRQAY